VTNSRVRGVDVVDKEGSCDDRLAAASEELQPSELVASKEDTEIFFSTTSAPLSTVQIAAGIL